MQLDSEQGTFEEVEVLIDGRQVKVKSIKKSKQGLMLTTETGEVIVVLPESKVDFDAEDFDSSKALFENGEKVKGAFPLYFCKLRQVQSNFISQVACGKEHAMLLT